MKHRDNIPKIGPTGRQTRNDQRHSAVKNHRQKQANLRAKRMRAQKWQQHKLPIIAILFVIVLGLFLWEIARLQEFAGEAYAIRALNQIVNHHAGDDRTAIAPNRGTITDRNMQALAMSSTVFNVFVDVRMLDGRSEAETENNRRALTEFFEMTNAEFSAMMARDAAGRLVNDVHYFVIERSRPHSRLVEFDNWVAEARTVARANDETFLIRDIHFEESSRRNYIHNTLAAPVLGFERGLWWGLEERYNQYLSGSVGRLLTTFDSDGSFIRDRISPTHGAVVVTTLDLAIQRFAEEVAERWAIDFDAPYASIIVMQPFTGEIVAMAQYPGFDANNPTDIHGITSPTRTARLEELEEGSDEFFHYLFGIWQNFNVTHSFEPGSIYKPFTAAKALEEGLISPNHMFYCEGFKYVAGHRINCARTWGHGLIDLTTAIAVSCNIAHMEMAEIVGRDAFWRYQRDFGYGAPTGIDFPGESAGRIFTRDALNASELATSSFGQRFEATPMQSIVSFAGLINGGYIVRPHLVSRVIDNEDNILFSAAPIIERQVISRETSDWMRRAMEYAVTDGSAIGATIEGYAQGGKTGTAEQGVREIDPNFTWALTYIGYFPVEDPQYIIFVALHDVSEEVYEARLSNRSVAPMYREVAQEIIRLRGLPPTTEVNPGLMHESEFIEDFTGISVQQAVARLNSLGIDYQFIGQSGNFVFSQFPAAGSRSTSRENLTIMLTIMDNGGDVLVDVPNVVDYPVFFAQEMLMHLGFVPRVVYEERLEDNDVPDVPSVVASQSASGVRLPLGTEILLWATFD